MAILGVFTIMLLFGLVAGGLWIWSLVDALRFTDQQWAVAGQNKVLWVVLIIVLGIIGSAIYVLVARPALAGTRSASLG